jgi:cell wall-associated NlpC family hydrolase
MADPMASVQARIAEIEQKFTPQAQKSSTATAANNALFAQLLEAASGTGTGDGTGLGTGTDLSSLLSGVLGGDTSGLGSLGSTLGSTTGSSGLAGLSGLTATGTTAKTQTFVQSALAQAGDPYVWGASASPTDPNPTAFDCSELVRWAGKRAGVDLPDGSWLQYLSLKQQGATIPVAQALQTPGALLFSFSSEPVPGGGRPSHAHVAISLGDGRTIEARGRKYGVGSFDAGNRFQYAAVVPGLLR